MANALRRTGGIQEEDVWRAADALLLAGERPTIERVRRELGRGSPNTVSPYLDRWFAGLGARLADPKAFAPLAGAPDPVLQAARHLWEVACAQARADITAQFEVRQNQLTTMQVQLEQERAAVAARSEGLERALEEAGERNRAAVELTARLQAALDESVAAGNAAQAALDEERRLRQTLEAKIRQQQESFAELRLTLDKRADEERRRAALEIDQARQAVQRMRTDLQKRETELANAQATQQQLTKAHSQAQDAWQQERAALAEAVAKERADRATAQEVEKRTAARAASLLARVDRLQKQMTAAADAQAKRDVKHAALLRRLVNEGRSPRGTNR